MLSALLGGVSIVIVTLLTISDHNIGIIKIEINRIRHSIRLLVINLSEVFVALSFLFINVLDDIVFVFQYL